MASQLSTIYSTMAGWPFTAGGKSVTARYGSTLRNSVASGDLPVRLLMPFDQDQEGDSIQTISLSGALAVAVWTLRDILLIKPITQGSGLDEAAPVMIAYQQAYNDALKTGRILFRNTDGSAVIESAKALPGIVEWPVESETYYNAVTYELSIKEVY